jgi:cellulose synthase/poly-beta-1,6-N-acetylglucosamine synthase-like glycosyltransferase
MLFMTVIIWTSYLLSLYFLVYWLLLFLENRDRIREEYDQLPLLRRYPLVSVLVPAYNEERTVGKTLESLVALDWPAEKLEIIVIDDGSKDRTSAVTREFIRKHPRAPVRLLVQKNQGKAAALNHGLRVLKGEYFACLDADSFVEPQALKHMIHWHERHKNLAITTPVMKVATPKNWVQKFQRLEYMGAMLLTRLMSYMNANYVAPGPFSTYKTAIIRKLGGFDERNLVEDQEIAYRAQERHYTIMQVPHAVVYTKAPETLKQLSKQRNRWFKGSLLNIFKYKHMAFRRSYGDFGVFQMPVNMVAFLLGVIAFIAFMYYMVWGLLRHAYNYWLVGFDLIPYLRDWKLTFNILELQVTPMFILYFMLALSLVFLFFASRTNSDRVRAYGTLYIIPYFFLYFILMSYITVRVIVEVILGKKQKW